MYQIHILLLCITVLRFVIAIPAVTIQNGTVFGSSDLANGVEKFLGIPYAQPPVSGLRLRHSLPLNNTFGKLNATGFGSSCYGGNNPNPSEDCLSINIWRPTNVTGPLPVLVWLYGGSLIRGYTSDPRFEGTNMIRMSRMIGKPVLLVSLNYRMGPLGFLNGKQMAELGLLNLGMLDQRLAFRWIHENIAAFGGNPSKVTLAGQSAGAVSIYSHMMAYGGRDDGLFRGAILQSGGAFPLTGPDTVTFQRNFDSLIVNTTCSPLANAASGEQLECIRSLPIETFLESVGSGTGQSIDGSFTTTSVQFAFPAGKYVKVATMVGSNTDEGTTSAPTGVNTTEQLRGPLADGFFRPKKLPNSTVDALLDLYSADPLLGCPYNTGHIKLSSGVLDKQACSIFGDIVQIAPARMIAQSLTANNGDTPVYRYRFNHLPRNASDLSRGITTGLELNYVFSNQVADFPWDQALAFQMTSAWVSFAYDLDPNHEKFSNLPYWPQYGSHALSMSFNAFGSVIESDDYRAEGINYIIDNVLPYGAL